MAASVVELVERHWLALALASPVIVYASWIAALVVPEVLKAWEST